LRLAQLRFAVGGFPLQALTDNHKTRTLFALALLVLAQNIQVLAFWQRGVVNLESFKAICSLICLIVAAFLFRCARKFLVTRWLA
jgi:hypothetical protein